MALTIDSKKILTFLIIGTGVAIFQYLSFHVLWREWGITYLLASSVSFFLTVLLSFFVQKFITFRELLKREQRKSTAVSLALFSVNALLGLVVNGCIMFVGIEVFQFSPYGVQAFSMLVLASYNFFIYQLILR